MELISIFGTVGRITGEQSRSTLPIDEGSQPEEDGLQHQPKSHLRTGLGLGSLRATLWISITHCGLIRQRLYTKPGTEKVQILAVFTSRLKGGNNSMSLAALLRF